MTEQNPKKILIMGLDKAGKTSIVLSLKGVKNLLSFYSLNPTKGANIVKFKALNSDYIVWDFGGQEIYRKEYLKNFKQYISGINKFIFVIDVQDVDRYDLALDYMKNILNILLNNQINVGFSIFLHKFDPDLEDYNKKIKEEVIKSLIKKIEGLMPTDFSYSIDKTSIYTVFEKSSID